jgi:hypothetical protein
MAVLDRLLAGNSRARAIRELADTVNRHERWLADKKFLMVSYHMIGARDVESAILGGYAEHVRRVNQNAPIPAFYLGERLFQDARGPRNQFGDDAFFPAVERGQAGCQPLHHPRLAPAGPQDPPRGPLRQPPEGHSATRGALLWTTGTSLQHMGQFWTPIQGQHSKPIDSQQ